MHLAQLNIGRLAHPHDDPRVAEFMDNLDLVNGIADHAKGFVWRQQDDSGNATAIALDGDPLFISNMSVWESFEDFERFVWDTIHRRFVEKRAAWFEPSRSRHFVMWWIEPGHVPTLEEARERLAHLIEHGNSDHAFGWDHLAQSKQGRMVAEPGFAAGREA